MLMPKKMKFRKQQRNPQYGKAKRGFSLAFGKFGIKAMTAGRLSAREIEAARRAMTRYIKRGGEVWIRVFPDKPITMKSAEVPMGSGKGAVDHFAAVIKPGRILFEMDGVTREVAKEAMRLAEHKISVQTKFVSREEE